MRQILSRSALTVAAASSILAVTGGYAAADSEAQGGAVGSPGVLSGNTVSAPVDVPVNACGNTVDVVGAENPAFGNTCANVSHSAHHHPSGAHAQHIAEGSPGVAAGNAVDAPVHTPVNACGNSADVVALLNPAFGDTCVNGGTAPAAETPQGPGAPGGPDVPATPEAPGVQQPASTPPRAQDRPPASAARHLDAPRASLADTGVSGSETGLAGAAAAALLLGGAILYRRAPRPAAARARR